MAEDMIIYKFHENPITDKEVDYFLRRIFNFLYDDNIRNKYLKEIRFYPKRLEYEFELNDLVGTIITVKKCQKI